MDGSVHAIKKGPREGPCVHKVEDSRRRLSLKGGKRRLRTIPIKRSGRVITSKMAVNFIGDMHCDIISMEESDGRALV